MQKDGEPPQELHPGDSVSIAPDERHWHGAVADKVFVHLSMQAARPDGNKLSGSSQ